MEADMVRPIIVDNNRRPGPPEGRQPLLPRG